jgi:hypothetical protein
MKARETKPTYLTETEGASTEILCSHELSINFLWKNFTGFIMLCDAQKSLPVTAMQQFINFPESGKIQAIDHTR